MLKALTTFLFRLLTAQELDLRHVHWKFGFLILDTSWIIAAEMSPYYRNFLDLGLTLEYNYCYCAHRDILAAAPVRRSTLRGGQKWLIIAVGCEQVLRWRQVA